MIAIVDYGAGNLRSVARALEKLGFPAQVTSDPQTVAAAQAIILPGVGAAAEAMRQLAERGLDRALRHAIDENRPMFGVCLGLQLLFDRTEEDGGARCLGILPGVVRRLPSGLKVPHMGWNQVIPTSRDHWLFEGTPDGANFYFVHSYYGYPVDPSLIVGQTEYGVTFGSVLARGNLVATQFHPEKSGDLGLRLYHNFLTHFPTG
ncbi:MAG: imidazole glycerol phosphate synthase subunit HisH [Chloroflexi bacterium]|nr:imidazole glycerol phosphate synthase subunit HisH [Chloroflexota bacterium]